MIGSVLAVPASNERMCAKALASNGSLVFLDLEDSVAPSAKTEARNQAISTVLAGDWQGRPTAVRVNDLRSAWGVEDLAELGESVGGRLDFVILPKVESAADIRTAADALPNARIHAQVETARGLYEIREIASASGSLEALVFGPGDFAASMGMPGTNVGSYDQWEAAYGQHRFHHVMSEILVAARANGLLAIDGPYADYHDPTGLRRSSVTARALGYDGKWAIHPGQLETINQVFQPTGEEIIWAQAVMTAYQNAVAAGEGATGLDGQMLDMASVRMAERVLGS